MTHFRIREAAALLGVSDDTVRRWAAEGLLVSGTDEAGVQTVSGPSLAERAKQLAPEAGADNAILSSARNRLAGIVTRVEIEGLVAVVELQCGPNRIVSLMTAEAARELGLEVGSFATASVKATQVVVEAPRQESRSA